MAKKLNTMINAKLTINSFKIPDKPVYLVGAYDHGVTVLNQQIRALNLAWALVETATVNISNLIERKKKLEIAIVGGGFTGITLAAALLKKGISANITIFEQRDTLLPLQQGSDSRWLHPRIYDWPAEGSTASSAQLPVLNWTAGRASDVVVQVLSSWKDIVLDTHNKPRLYCNTKHLQIREGKKSKICLEWVGEERDPLTAGALKKHGGSGLAKDFDMAILAVGFGVEKNGVISYWRNETLSQPSLDNPRRTFIISGQGDGAMIDLLRLCISQFRQDRILSELFSGSTHLISKLRDIRNEHLNNEDLNLFNLFEKLDFKEVLNSLSSRLRQDTEVLLRLKVREFSQLFSNSTSRISFQNKLLVYLLYRCGGFTPTTLSDASLKRLYGISPSNIIQRHGSDREEVLKKILSDDLYHSITKAGNSAPSKHFSQPENISWPGGYFGYPGLEINAEQLPEAIKAVGRREYLPGPTEFMATSFCSAIAGYLLANHAPSSRLRVTLHRAIPLGNEVVLQQACDYVGTQNAAGEKSAAARTFPAHNATVGLAFKNHAIVRSKKMIKAEDLVKTMEILQLNQASRKMSGDVKFVLAIPLLSTLAPPNTDKFVTGVLYIDSTQNEYFIEDASLEYLVSMCNTLLKSLSKDQINQFDRLNNTTISRKFISMLESSETRTIKSDNLEILKNINAPQVCKNFHFNFDYSDYSTI